MAMIWSHRRVSEIDRCLIKGPVSLRVPRPYPPHVCQSVQTGDRLAFFRSWIKLGYNFYDVNWIPDHQNYNISRVDLNIDRVRLS